MNSKKPQPDWPVSKYKSKGKSEKSTWLDGWLGGETA